MKKQTNDRARFYVTETIGEKRSTTPEGFLVCNDVPIARTGTQLYTVEEIPIEPGPDGLIRIERSPEEVFRDDTISSFEGKAVTVEHPNDFVTPENWQQLSVGFVQNVRRGEGINDDLLIADLVITDPAAIKYVNEELPEVSAGYEAEYQQTEPGRGLQRDIVGNHVALVERGRAGPRCSIQDKEPIMAKKLSFIDRLRLLLKDAEAEAEEMKEEGKTADSDEQEEENKEAKTGDEGSDLATLTQRLERIEGILAKLIPAEEEEHGENFDAEPDEEDGQEKKTADDVLEAEQAENNSEVKGTVLSGDSMKQVIARAEILSPGIAVPTGDAAGKKGAAHGLMRKAIVTAMTTDYGKAAIEPFLMGRDVKSLTADALASVFTGAAEMIRAQNNARGARSGVNTKDFGRVSTVSAINARNREFWANRAR